MLIFNFGREREGAAAVAGVWPAAVPGAWWRRCRQCRGGVGVQRRGWGGSGGVAQRPREWRQPHNLLL